MNFSKQVKLNSIVVCLTIFVSLFLPIQAEAKINFGKFLRSVRRGTSFVVNLPNKATRFLGPTLGPIAADLISVNLGKSPRFGAFFNKVRKINSITSNIEDQNRLVNELKQIYNDQANDLNKQADEIRKIRKDLARDLIEGNITRQEHLDRVADLEAIAQAYTDTADRFRRSADRLNPAQIIKILGTDYIKRNALNIKNLVRSQATNELNRLFHPDIINTILSGGNSPEDLLEVLFSDDLKDLKSNPDFDFDKFKDDLLIKIQQMLKDDKNALKDNWYQTMQNLIKIQIKDNKPSQDSNNSTDKQTTLSQPPSSQELDENGCKPGYIFRPRSGVGCVQENCEKGAIPNAHLSYTGQCICGSAGSINENPDDPNKPCRYDNSYTSCPSCVYACVHTNEDCPNL